MPYPSPYIPLAAAHMIRYIYNPGMDIEGVRCITKQQNVLPGGAISRINDAEWSVPAGQLESHIPVKEITISRINENSHQSEIVEKLHVVVLSADVIYQSLISPYRHLVVIPEWDDLDIDVALINAMIAGETLSRRLFKLQRRTGWLRFFYRHRFLTSEVVRLRLIPANQSYTEWAIRKSDEMRASPGYMLSGPDNFTRRLFSLLGQRTDISYAQALTALLKYFGLHLEWGIFWTSEEVSPTGKIAAIRERIREHARKLLKHDGNSGE